MKIGFERVYKCSFCVLLHVPSESFIQEAKKQDSVVESNSKTIDERMKV